MFRVGMKVVCIFDGRWEVYGHETTPQIGGVYTIRDINFSTNSGCAFLFEEIRNSPDLYVSGARTLESEKHWRSSRFRPIVERKTSIEIFTKMLTGNRENINA